MKLSDDTPPIDQVAEQLVLNNDDKAALQRMYQELKKDLKQRSKNELIRIVGATMIELHFTRNALNELTRLTTKPAETSNE